MEGGLRTTSNTRLVPVGNNAKTMKPHLSTSSATSVDTFTTRRSSIVQNQHKYWKCSTCTYENNEGDPHCDMCSDTAPSLAQPVTKPVRITMKKVDGRRFGLSISSTAEGHFVEKVASNGLAAETGQVTVGMKLIAINDVETTELSKLKCIELFKQATEAVTLDLLDVGYGAPAESCDSETPTGREYTKDEKRSGLLVPKTSNKSGSNTSLSAFPGRKMSTPEARAAAEHVEDLTRMLDSLKSFSAMAMEDGHEADDHDHTDSVDTPPSNRGLSAASFQTSMSFVKSVLQRAAEGPIDGRTIQDLLFDHWGEDLDSSNASMQGAASDWGTKEKEKMQRKVMRLESESRSIAKRLLDQQTTFAKQLNDLESENESLRAYVDRLMGQLLSARMEQPRLLVQEEENKRMSRRTRSPRMPRPSSMIN
eukprot:m.243109 g.243109  ORF g.243109 m.243109 type:complete len:423 (-) comp33806_c8_seq1:124-1392(-)